MAINSRERAVQYFKLAIEHDERERYEEALDSYLQGLHVLHAAIKNENDQSRKGEMNEWMKTYLSRAEKLKEWLNKKSPKKEVEVLVEAHSSLPSLSDLYSLRLSSGSATVTNFRGKAIDALIKAVEYDNEKEYEKAMSMYKCGIDWLQAAPKC
uniref:MIT domain-containing protein n=1 Tax=Palpitomonas bilix TaxID=652834 RepID=A0A7S3CYR2_9EUKA|mmetsp:Transcript_15094/g.38148  ORF Transcript_15094/g.38148 Transcript_15094/m.38148 type:complete len:154 (+) Transcript_15094:64-525(+)